MSCVQASGQANLGKCSERPTVFGPWAIGAHADGLLLSAISSLGQIISLHNELLSYVNKFRHHILPCIRKHHAKRIAFSSGGQDGKRDAHPRRQQRARVAINRTARALSLCLIGSKNWHGIFVGSSQHSSHRHSCRKQGCTLSSFEMPFELSHAGVKGWHFVIFFFFFRLFRHKFETRKKENSADCRQTRYCFAFSKLCPLLQGTFSFFFFFCMGNKLFCLPLPSTVFPKLFKIITGIFLPNLVKAKWQK